MKFYKIKKGVLERSLADSRSPVVLVYYPQSQGLGRSRSDFGERCFKKVVTLIRGGSTMQRTICNMEVLPVCNEEL